METSKPFKIEDVPIEVQEVWAIQIACKMGLPGIGMQSWNNCQRIINLYPEWFSEETYNDYLNKKEE